MIGVPSARLKPYSGTLTVRCSPHPSRGDEIALSDPLPSAADCAKDGLASNVRSSACFSVLLFPALIDLPRLGVEPADASQSYVRRDTDPFVCCM